MPFIPRETLQCSIFLYPSRHDAEAGENWGGSGVLFGAPSRASQSRVHLYAVSNHHVSHNNPTIRLSTVDGTVEIVERREEDWTQHPFGDDIAVCPLGAVIAGQYEYVVTDELLSERAMTDPWFLGPGDDCFMVGRYIDRHQRQFDQPALRFGNLSMMVEPIRQTRRGCDQDSFLVEMRSQAGFSGSPVFVYYEGFGPRIELADGEKWRPFTWDRSEEAKQTMLHLLPGERQPSGIIEQLWLLGIDWGHIPVWTDVTDVDGNKVGKMEANSGVAGVVPSWKLAELLASEDLAKGRAATDTAIKKDDESAGVLGRGECPEPSWEFNRFEMRMGDVVSKRHGGA